MSEYLDNIYLHKLQMLFLVWSDLYSYVMRNNHVLYSSGMWRRLFGYISTSISKETTFPVIKIDDPNSWQRQ